MSNNQLNDISKVYLSQVAEETPGERIDKKSQEGVAKRSAAASSEKESRAKSAAAFQKHKQSVLAKGGRHVDALDSWHKKQAYERNAKTRSEALMSSEELKEKEIYKGKHGQSEKEYQAGRSDAGKRISGDEKHGPASYTRRGVVDQKPTKPGEKPKHTPKLGSAEKNELAYRKSRLLKKEALSDWRTDLSDIIEAGPLTSSPSLSQDGVMMDNQNLDQVPAKKKRMSQTEFEKEVDEKNVKNKVIINPTFQESIREIGGEVLEAVETEVDEYLETVSKVKRAENVADKERWAVDEAVKGEDTQRRKDASAERRKGIGKLKSKKEGESYAKWTMAKHPKHVDEQLDDKKKEDDPTLAAKEKRISMMKKMVLLKKMQAVRSGAGAEITASYEPEGEVIDETLMSVKAATYGMPNEKRKAIIDKYKRSEENRGTDKKKGRDAGAIARERLNKEETIIERPLTGYEDKKKEEVITALKKKKPEFKKRYGKDAPDVMYAVAAKTAKKKGDTSKSDDRYAYEEIEFAVVGEEVECNCDCGKDPCVKCGEGHHKLGEEASVSGQELKYCKRCKKPETRNDCAYGPEEWDRSAVDVELGEETVYEATGRWVDSKGRSHKFSISTNTVVDHGYIKDLVKSRYPAKRIFIKTDKEKSKKKKDEKKVKKESFSNWREENLTENGNKNKPGYVDIGMGVWVKKEDAEKKKAQLAKSVRGENIPGFKRGRLD